MYGPPGETLMGQAEICQEQITENNQALRRHFNYLQTALIWISAALPLAILASATVYAMSYPKQTEIRAPRAG